MPLIFSLLFATTLFAQRKPNPKIDKKEIQASLFYFSNNNYFGFDYREALGGELVYRLTWNKYTKIGSGGLITGEHNRFTPAGYQAYGALFADITQFIGQRQKWSASGQVGHGIYHSEYTYSSSNENGFTKYSAGMYYSISANYRMIISKKVLITISPFGALRNLRRRMVTEHFSPPAVERSKKVETNDGVGLRIGVVF